MSRVYSLLLAVISILAKLMALAGFFSLLLLIALLVLAVLRPLDHRFFGEWRSPKYMSSNYHVILPSQYSMMPASTLTVYKNTYHEPSDRIPNPWGRMVVVHAAPWMPIHYQEEEHFANDSGTKIARRAYCYRFNIPYLIVLNVLGLGLLHLVPVVRRTSVGAMQTLAWVCAAPVKLLWPKQPGRFPID